MPFNHKDERIARLFLRGVTDPVQIARKIGYGNPPSESGVQRVKEGLARLNIIPV